MITLTLFGIFAICLMISVPIAVSLGLASFAVIFIFGNLQLELFIRTLATSLDTFPLLAVPLFILAGDLMSRGGISERLFQVANLIVGRFTGGYAMAAVLTCMFFGAISGSGPATVAAIGSLLIPMMANLGYKKTFSTGLIASAGGVGVIIPPSIPMIMYGVVTGVSISDLFIAGILPGIVVGIALMIYGYVYCKINGPILTIDKKQEVNILKVINDSKWALLMPVIILGGIYGGVFTPTEAAGVAVFYALIISIFIYKSIKFKDIGRILLDSAMLIGPLMIIVSVATVFGRILALEKVPVVIAEFITNISTNEIVVILIINLFLLIVGAVMDTVAAILILAPILLPVALQFGFDPIHFGIIMIVNLAIGFITPPIGMNLFIASGITGLSIETISKQVIVPILVLIVTLLIITFIPAISLVLLK